MKKIKCIALVYFALFSLFFGEGNMNIKEHQNKSLYNAIERLDVQAVGQLLDDGQSPNICEGIGGWYDKDPLCVLATKTFYSLESKSSEFPDQEILTMLVKRGGLINKRPYIWFRVFTFGNKHIEIAYKYSWDKKFERGEITSDQYKIGYLNDVESLVKESNRLIQAFIDSGADPDMRGHQKPFEKNVFTQLYMNDWIASQYFKKGTRPINEAIKKGMVWESQVDLLFRYVKLDTDSLKAAQESNDTAMIAKINSLWEKQEAGKNKSIASP